MNRLICLVIFLIFTFLIICCTDSRRNKLLSILHNDQAKRWELVGENDTIFKGQQSIGCINFYRNHSYKAYRYFKNGDVLEVNRGDIDIPNYYDIINDSLFYLGNAYMSIQKFNKDTLILKDLCRLGTVIYKSSNLKPDEKKVYDPLTNTESH